MARINIEESLWTDPKQRFTKFCIKLGDEVRALGYVVQAWRMAQAHWCPDKKPIPDAEWKASGMPNEMIEAGLAERRGGGVYLKGSEEQFAWWFQKRAAGIASGKARGSGNESSTPDDQGPAPVNGRSTNDDVREPLSSSLFSLSSSLSAPPSLLITDSASAAAPPPDVGKGKDRALPRGKPPAKTAAVWTTFTAAYRIRYDVDLADNPKVRSQMARFIDQVGADDAPAIAEFYVRHNKRFYVEKAHDFGLCLADAVKLRTEWLRGGQVTEAEARAVDRRQTTFNAFAPLLAEAEQREREKEIRDAC